MNQGLSNPEWYQVGVCFLVVPDNVRLVGNKRVCRLSLAVAPTREKGFGDLPLVDIRSWPTEIARLTQNLRVAVTRVLKAPNNQQPSIDEHFGYIEEKAGVPKIFRSDVPRSDLTESKAAKLWTTIFAESPDPDEGFRNLLAALAQKSIGEQPNPAVEEKHFGTYHSADLAEVIDTIYDSAAATALLQRLAVVAAKSTGKWPKAQQQYVDAGKPGTMWWQMVYNNWVGTAPLQDAVSKLSAQFPSGSRKPPVLTFREQLRQRLRLAFKLFRGDWNQADLSIHRKARASHAAGLSGAASYFASQIGNATFWQNGQIEIKTDSKKDGDASDSKHFEQNMLAGMEFEILEKGFELFNREILGSVREYRSSTVYAAAALRAEIGRFCECLGHGYKLVDYASSRTTKEERVEVAGRKYASILSHPTLAKYLGLVVDVDVDADLLSSKTSPSRTYGAVAVDASRDNVGERPQSAGANKFGWTIYVSQLADKNGEPDYFGPCGRSEAASQVVDSNQTLFDGLLNLGVRIDDQPRFKLETLDVNNATIGLNKRSVEVSEADIKGSLPSQQITQFPERQAHGIALYDRHREIDEMLKAKSEQQSVPFGNGNLCLRFLEDLVLGYRIDAAMTVKDGHWPNQKRWRPLIARTVEYLDVPPKFLRHSAVKSVRERDDGHVRYMTGTATLSDGEVTKTQTTPVPDLFTWPGESLAVPTLGDEEIVPEAGRKADLKRMDRDCRTVWPNPHCDLAINIDIDLPLPPRRDELDRRPLPLREGRGYMFGARLYLVNGCGLSFKEALKHYAKLQCRLVLGNEDNSPFVYRRRTPVPAPDVLLPWNDRIVVAQNADEFSGENIDYLVVRSGEIQTKKARRFVVPPRISFDLAERHGMFDEDTTSAVPPGAFVSECIATLHPTRATFPVSRSGHWEFPDIVARGRKVTNTKLMRETSRGAVLVLDNAAKKPYDQLYLDPQSRSLRARFTQNGTSLMSFGELDRPREFWSSMESPACARPILLELNAANSTNRHSLRGWFDLADVKGCVRPRNANADLILNKLSVILAPAETIDLELWCDPDPNYLLKTHQSVVNMLDLIGEQEIEERVESLNLGVQDFDTAKFRELLQSLLNDESKKQNEVLSAVLAQSALPQITSKRIVRLIHAVDRPVEPRFLRSDICELHLNAVVVSLGKPGHQLATGDAWETYVNDQKQSEVYKWPSQESGSCAFFVGEIFVDRPTTSKVRCEARWLEYGSDSIRQDPSRKRWIISAPFNFAQLFAVELISTDEPLRERPINLLLDDQTPAKLRTLFHIFPDGKARNLKLRLISTSRFREFYPPETKAQKASRERTGVGRYDRGTKSFDESATSLWVKCTFRPPQPEIDRTLPVFHWYTATHDQRREITWKRDSSVRVYLKSPLKSPWFASGEGEMLGVVCWPESLVSPSPTDEAIAAQNYRRYKLEDLDKISDGKYAQYVTRWGSDPIHLSGQLEDLISADRFTEFDDKASGLLLTIETSDQYSEDPKASIQPLPVSVIAFTPHLDSIDGSFYCDIPIDHGSAYFPFIQLGLVRYQAHAVHGLELSRPIAAWAQIPPRREGRVIFKDDRRFSGELHGIGYHRSETGSEYDNKRHLTDFPLINVRLMQATRDSRVASNVNSKTKWRPVVDKYGQPIEKLHLLPVQRGAEVWWTFDFTLPTSRAAVHYGLLIEEIELMVADKIVEQSGVRECKDMQFPTELVERGPLFSHLVDLAT